MVTEDRRSSAPRRGMPRGAYFPRATSTPRTASAATAGKVPEASKVALTWGHPGTSPAPVTLPPDQRAHRLRSFRLMLPSAGLVAPEGGSRKAAHTAVKLLPCNRIAGLLQRRAWRSTPTAPLRRPHRRRSHRLQRHRHIQARSARGPRVGVAEASSSSAETALRSARRTLIGVQMRRRLAQRESSQPTRCLVTARCAMSGVRAQTRSVRLRREGGAGA